MGQGHVDQRRRQERVGDPVPCDVLEEAADVGRPHHHDLAAEGQHREAEHAGRVGQRREGEVDRPPLERVAHQRDRRHRLEVGAGEHHALGPAGGAAGADDHGQVLGRSRSSSRSAAARRGTRPRSAPRRPGRRGRPAWSASGRSPRICATSSAYDAWKTSARQPNSSSSSRFSAASLRGLIGHQTAPTRLIPKTRGERVGVVGRQDRHGVAGRDALADQTRGDPPAELLHLGIAPGLAVRGEAGRVRSEGRALVEVVRQLHVVDQLSTVTTGSDTRPKLRSTPSSSRWPNAWQPEANPTRFGGCWSSEYAA